MIKMNKIGFYIESQTMHTDPTTHMDSDGTYLAISRRTRPNSCKSGSPIPFKTKIGHSTDDHYHQQTNIAVKIPKKKLEIKNRIYYKLARSVISDVSAAIDVMIGDVMFA